MCGWVGWRLRPRRRRQSVPLAPLGVAARHDGVGPRVHVRSRCRRLAGDRGPLRTRDAGGRIHAAKSRCERHRTGNLDAWPPKFEASPRVQRGQAVLKKRKRIWLAPSRLREKPARHGQRLERPWACRLRPRGSGSRTPWRNVGPLLRSRQEVMSQKDKARSLCRSTTSSRGLDTLRVAEMYRTRLAS
jgi:hypothetical protein